MGVIRDILDIAKTSGGGGGGGNGSGGAADAGASIYRKNRAKQKQASGDDSTTGDDWAGSFKRGGKVRKTGIAKVHKGEEVLTAKEAKKRYRGRGRNRR
jgi:hypothetical protein